MDQTIPLGELRHLQEGVEFIKSQKFFQQEELDAMREQLFIKEAEIDNLKTTLAEQTKFLRDKIKSETLARTAIKKIVRQGYQDVDIECYKVPDLQSGMMGFYSVDTGDLVTSRRLLPEERQMRAPLRLAHND